MMPIAFLQNMGVEWIVILVVALLIFGHKLPQMFRGMGASVGEFKKGIRDGEMEATKDAQQEKTAATADKK